MRPLGFRGLPSGLGLHPRGADVAIEEGAMPLTKMTEEVILAVTDSQGPW